MTQTDRTVRVLAVRQGSASDVLLAGPAVRALAARYGQVDLLVTSSGAPAAALLPGVTETLQFDAPWAGTDAPPLNREAVLDLVVGLATRRYQLAVIFTSFHQSPLPMALLARLAGVRSVVATSEDYPGSLVDAQHQRPAGLHEVEACLDLVEQADAPLPAGDDGLMAVRRPLPPVPQRAAQALGFESAQRSVVLHPGPMASARAPRAEDARTIAAQLSCEGWHVLVTGSPAERNLTAYVAGNHATDLGGCTTLAELAAVLEAAACAVVGNAAPAHLAAAAGTPVVSLFAPVVPVDRWAPYGVPRLVLGDQGAACHGTHAPTCPVPGHPCLASITPDQVTDAVARIT